MQSAIPPAERIGEALRTWQARESTVLLVTYAGLIAVLSPASYFITRWIPAHPDSLRAHLLAAAVSSAVLLAMLYQPFRAYALRLQAINIGVFLAALMTTLVSSGNSLWYVAVTIVALFGVQYAFLRPKHLVAIYAGAFIFEAIYSVAHAGFANHHNLFVTALIGLACAFSVASGLLRIRSQFAGVELRTRLQMQTEELQRQSQRVRSLAYSDSLTGLPNRAGMNDRVDRALDFAAQHGLMAALLYLDLDGFKQINDTHGHDVGDLVLLGAALRIQYVLRHGESIGRIGGDEFVVLVPAIEEADDALAVVRRIRDVLHEPFAVGDTQFTLSASIGIALFPHDGGTRLELLAHADQAMYRIKGERRRAAAPTGT